MSIGQTKARRLYNEGKLRENYLPRIPLCGEDKLTPLNLANINSVGRRLLGEWFVGCFEEDRLPRPPSRREGGWAMIVNTLRHNAPMSKDGHWVALCETSDGQSHFFDSYGRQPLMTPWYDYLKHYSRNSHHPPSFNPIVVQAFDTNSCGYFCLEYLKVRKVLTNLPDRNLVLSYLPREKKLCQHANEILTSPHPIITLPSTVL